MDKEKIMNIGKRYFIVRERIFNRRVHCFINYSRGDFNNWCKKKRYESNSADNDNDIVAFSSDMRIDDKPTEWIILIKSFDWTLTDQGSLIHEIVHTIIKIWERNNMSVNEETQEFFAHEINNMYEDIFAKILKLKKIKKKK